MFSMTTSDANADELTPETFEELLPEFDTFIFGADGLVWLRNGVITDAANLVNLLIEKRKEILILTNDTTHSRESHMKKLMEHRFRSKLNKEHIVTPALLTADYIKSNKILDGKSVYLVDSGGIGIDLKECGVTFFGDGPDLLPDQISNNAELINVNHSLQQGEVCAVLVGQDRHFNFKKLMKAANFLKNPHCLFLATNDSSVILDENSDVVIPDAGAIAAAVRKASGREPVVLGKPSSHGFEYIKKKWKIDQSRTVMICSNIECDVVFGRKHGMRTLLILNKPYEREQLEKLREQQKYESLPHYYATSISAILPPNR